MKNQTIDWSKCCQEQDIQLLHKKTPYIICNVSYGYFSIARYYGGAKFNGEHYTYDSHTDTLIRDDVWKIVKKKSRKRRKQNKE